MTPNLSARVSALSSHLLDGFLQLREKYELLEPMLFDQNLVAERGSGKPARGFSTLRHTLFIGCIQDIAKCCLDTDRRTPSISNIVKALADDRIRAELALNFSVWDIPVSDDYTDPIIIEALQRIEHRKQAQRRQQFEELSAELFSRWDVLRNKPEIQAFLTVRDRISAHTEIRQVADKYVAIDIGELGIKWGDIRSTISDMQRLIELCGLLVRNTSFAGFVGPTT